MKRMQIFCFVVISFFDIPAFTADTTIVKSPAGTDVFKLFKNDHQLSLSISFPDKTIAGPGTLLKMVMDNDQTGLNN